MKKLVLLFAAAVVTMLSMSADTYNYLNFVNSSNQITQFSTSGLRMTFNGGKATVTADGQTQTINLSTMAYMEFTNTQAGGTTYLLGDMNCDGNVDVSDINAIINIMLGKAQASDFVGIADVTGDNSIDVSDVNAVINIMLGKI